jgi:DNA-binding beta-propeller fold protein YncE
MESPRGRVTRIVPLPNLVPDMPETQYVLNSAHHGLAIDRTGRKLCVAGTMDDYAAIVHRGTFSFRLYRGPNVAKPYWAGNGWNDTCWVSMSGTDHVLVIDYRTERVLAQVPVGDPRHVHGSRAHPQRVRPGVIANSLLR